eukprot:CAMPEP_0184455608 /NCGR_PEP_ID=MMETSP0740-20130409/23998_1 /TAXON_ID=385413 /ORGANISM="Thalassiosira miniscula, Strain CCMP1093" /LENGTH=88 /DNA_ID=CAMNT_0026827489 /DNA_START=545 /DNA_END=807 /DNA_ORIENTATION=-
MDEMKSAAEVEWVISLGIKKLDLELIWGAVVVEEGLTSTSSLPSMLATSATSTMEVLVMVVASSQEAPSLVVSDEDEDWVISTSVEMS